MDYSESSPPLRALAYIIFGAAMVSFTSVLVEVAHVGATATAFYRMFFGGIILFGITLVRGDRIWLGIKSLGIPLLCAFLFSLDLFFWHRSINFVGPGLATILGNMQVFFVALFAVWFLKEKLGWRLMVAIPFAVLGLFLIVRTGWGQQGGAVKLGVLYGLLTALSYALYILILRKSQTTGQKLQYSLIPNMAWVSLLSALLLGITVLVEPHAHFVIPDLQTWGALIGLGIMGQVLGWVCISKGLPKVDASIGGLALLLQPALALMWDILFFGRPTTALEYVGAAVVLGAIYLGSTKSKKGDS
ncbi:Threonine/homoserine efflux transporter RhtA [Fodinibius salinus]|uniref:Threonine/homoserine efflux transporter RhtA n=1 Tax=Fodinibius salinus TaxID=860790 RepID=A0A5D3YMS0_9BACT|nr:DMT family transporter [Fodinibius salinus]TYP93439.1 Threonine/homoserine efflux transporter RhtA [Fodinibius salinus]